MTEFGGAPRHGAPDVAGFDVEELVGYGATGEVWRAREQASGDIVALKVVRVDRPDARDRLRREAATLAGLTSPHVVRMRTVVTSGDALVLVLDFAGRGSLASLLAVRRHLTPAEVVTIGVAIARALVDVHGMGLVHGDISPANILFGSDGRPMLSDLGVARAVRQGGSDGRDGIETTLEYADPALLAGAPLAPACDVYALGAVCSRALGRDPDEAPETALDAVLVRAMSAGAERPDAARLAAELHAACDAAPVRLAGATVLTESAVTARPARPFAAPVGSISSVTADVADPMDGSLRGRALSRDVAPGASGWGALRDRVRSAPGGRGPVPRALVMAGWWRSARRAVSPRRALGRALAALAAMLLLVGAAGAGVWWARSATADAGEMSHVAAPAGLAVAMPERSSAPAPASPSTPAPISAPARISAPAGTPAVVRSERQHAEAWRTVVTALDAQRDLAFRRGDPRLLDNVYAPASQPLAEDTARLASLAERGLHARGLHLTVVAVRVMTASGRRADIEVRDLLPPYDVVDRADRVVEHFAGRGARGWLISLRHDRAGWRITSVAAAPG